MGILNRIRYNLIPPLQGLREGILEVADKAHLTAQKTKIMLAVRDLENELKKQYSRLGKLAYQLKDSHDIDALNYHPQAKSIYEVAKDINTKKAKLRKKLQALDDTGPDEQRSILKKAMEEAKAKILRITLAPGSPLKGRSLKEAELPPNTLILCIMRKSRLIIPDGETRFIGNDEIFVLGLEPEVDNLDMFRNPDGA